MPRYYFDISDDVTIDLDDFGTELLDEASARREAMLTLSELARDWIANSGADRQRISIDIRDESGGRFTITLWITMSKIASH